MTDRMSPEPAGESVYLPRWYDTEGGPPGSNLPTAIYELLPGEDHGLGPWRFKQFDSTEAAIAALAWAESQEVQS